MVDAMIAGRKTQTRRLGTSPLRSRVNFGDRLWVRETCRAEDSKSEGNGVRYRANDAFIRNEDQIGAASRWLDLYTYDHKRRPAGSWVPAIHMPRWASRLTLTVEEVKFEHLKGISHDDALAEGIEALPNEGEVERWKDYLHSDRCCWNPRDSYESLWRSLHKKSGERWEDNPYVVAFVFRVDQRNIDKLERANP
jgi:hypothetical protein